MFEGKKKLATPIKSCLIAVGVLLLSGQISGAFADSTRIGALDDDNWIGRVEARELDQETRWRAFGALFANAGQTGGGSDSGGPMILSVKPGGLQVTEHSLESLAKDHAWHLVAADSLRTSIDEIELLRPTETGLFGN